MTRRRFYFLLCMGLLVFTRSYDLDVSAQELGATPVLLGFAKQEKQEQPDYLPPNGPHYLPSKGDKPIDHLPQLNQQPLHWLLYYAGLCICLIVVRIRIQQIGAKYRGGLQ